MPRPALIAALAFALLVGDSSAGRHADLAEKRAAVRMPFAGGGTTGADLPKDHRRYWGGFAWDLHKAPGAEVRARFASSDGRVTLTVGTIADSNGVGFRVPVTVKVDGTTVGTVRYEHLVNVRVKAGPVDTGVVLGELPSGRPSSSECPGGKSWGFPWQEGRWEVCTSSGVHTHVEFRQGCWRSGLGSSKGIAAEAGIAMLSSAFGASRNEACHAKTLDGTNDAKTPSQSPPLSGPDGSYNWPGMKKCGSFPAGYRIYVYANRYLNCAQATRILKAWWLGPPGTVISHSGGSGALGWVTLTRHPGWRCTSGSGGGSCRRGRAVAGYQN